MTVGSSVKYTPKELSANVNVTHVSPLRELVLLLGALLGICVVAYLVLGACVDLVVPRISVDVEQRLGLLFSGLYANELRSAESGRLQAMVDGLAAQIADRPDCYRMHVIAHEQVNAVALPGGHIAVFTGLLKEVGSQDELAFVLAHELGHFVHRDHLRGIGRGLVLWCVSALLLGADNSITGIIGQSLSGVQLKFSRAQETRADLFALDLMHRRYGSVAGAQAFMRRIAEKERMGRLAYYFATHPHPQDRMAAIVAHTGKKGYRVQAGDAD
ncbi:M48 family metallopeptidase [Thermodesulfobacteriota bacterium]